VCWMRRTILALAMAACSSDVSRDPALVYLLERARADFATVKERMAKGEDASYACASPEDAVRELRARKRLDPIIAVWERVCGRDAPLAFARALVARIEQEKPPRPSSCFDLSRTTAKLDEKLKEDPEVKALGQKAKSLCP